MAGASLLALLPAFSLAANTSYKVSQIAVAGATQGTFAQGINKNNVVVGIATLANGNTEGFALVSGKYTILKEPKASGTTRAFGVNDSNEVVGDFLGKDGYYHGFTLIGGKYAQYDVALGSESTSIFGLNNAGDFAGTSGSEGYVNIGGTVTEFYGSGTDATYPNAINNSNQVVGQYQDSSGNWHGFSRVASSGTITEIAYPGALQTACVGINDSGVITGWYENSAQQFYGFIDTNGSFQTVDFLYANGINNAGTFVGTYIGPGAAGGVTY